MSSLRNTDPHCLRKDDAWLDADSALQTATTPCNHKILCTDLNPKATGKGRGAEGNIKFIIQNPDYDGGSGEKAAVESQKWENWPPRASEYGYKCREVCLKNCHDQEQHGTEKKREFMEL